MTLKRPLFGILRRLLAGTALSFGLISAVALVTPGTASAQYYPDYGRVRGLVDRTQSDLRASGDLDAGGHDRYRDAQKALSDFDRHLAKGHFDRGELDRVIDRLKGVLDHNTLQATSRDALLHDVEDFRMTRDRFVH